MTQLTIFSIFSKANKQTTFERKPRKKGINKDVISRRSCVAELNKQTQGLPAELQINPRVVQQPSLLARANPVRWRCGRDTK